MKKLALFFVLVLISLTSCEDEADSNLSWLEIHVTEAGGVPEFYTLKVYQGEKLIKSEDFDLNFSRRNVTEVSLAKGMYYLEAESGKRWVRDSVELVGSGREVVALGLGLGR